MQIQKPKYHVQIWKVVKVTLLIAFLVWFFNGLYQGYKAIPQPAKLEIKADELHIKTNYAPPTVEDLIIASSPDFDSQLLIRLAFLESSLNPKAVGDGHFNSRGLYQISKHYHPEVSDECAFDITCSTRWTIQQLKAGRGHWWTTYELAINH